MANKANREYQLKNVRFSYLYCFKPYKDRDTGNESYCSHFILPTNHPQFGEVVQIIKDVAQDFWGDEWESVYAEMRAKNKVCMKSGTAKGDIEGYKGNYFISGNKKTRFSVVETRGGANVELLQSDGRPFSGDYGNANVAFYAMQHVKGGKMINCDIQGIQYTRKGTPLGGGGKVAKPEEFGIDPSDADGAPPPASNVAKPAAAGNVDDLMG